MDSRGQIINYNEHVLQKLGFLIDVKNNNRVCKTDMRGFVINKMQYIKSSPSEV